MLTVEQIERYRDLFKQRFKSEVSFEEASIQAESLVQLMKQIYKPINIKTNERSKK